MFYVPKDETPQPSSALQPHSTAPGSILGSYPLMSPIAMQPVVRQASPQRPIQEDITLDSPKQQPKEFHSEPDPEIERLRSQLTEKEELLGQTKFELKEKELAMKQLRSQLFDKECKLRDLNAQLNSNMSQLEEKDKELRKTEEMFKEYGAWR